MFKQVASAFKAELNGARPFKAQRTDALNTTLHAMPASEPPIDKSVLDALRLVRAVFDIKPPHILVLRALIGYAQAKGCLIVFAGNEELRLRLDGMAQSTLTRHLAHLEEVGLIRRRDSPNGKRYPIRKGGRIVEAFGLDISPLRDLAPQILAMAGKGGAATRSVSGAVDRPSTDGSPTDRTGTNGEPAALMIPKMSTDATQNEQHIQNQNPESKTLYKNSALNRDQAKGFGNHREGPHVRTVQSGFQEDRSTGVGSRYPDSTLARYHDTLKSWYHDIADYWSGTIRSASDAHDCARSLLSMMGASERVWTLLVVAMGRDRAAICVLAIFRLGDEIRSPGAYLTGLAKRARRRELEIKRLVEWANKPAIARRAQRAVGHADSPGPS